MMNKRLYVCAIRHLALLLLTCVLLYARGEEPATFDSSGFNCVAILEVPGYTQPEALSDFPLLIKLGPHLAGFSYSQFLSPEGADLRMVSGQGVELCYEVDTWDPEGNSYIWVKVPLLRSAGTVLKAYWGKAGLARPECTTNGAVWSNGYLGVWHMNQPNVINAVNGFTGTAHGNITADGHIGSSQYFSTNTFTDYVEVGNLKATNLTIEAWTLHANTTEYGAPNKDDVVFRKQNAFQWYQWNVDWNLQLDIIGTTTYKFQHNNIQDLPLPAWSHLAVSYDCGTGTGCGYMNGVNRYRDVKGANAPALNENICTIGKSGGGSYYGRLDEVRLSGVARSPNWIWACHQNQLSPETFVSFEFIPKLMLARGSAENDLLLNWSGTGHVLQVSASLGADAYWMTNGIPDPVLINGINWVTVSCDAPSAFYRLVNPAKEFRLAVEPAGIDILQSDAASRVVTVQHLTGFMSYVSLAVSNLPSGVSTHFSPSQTRNSSVLSFDVSAAASAGRSLITIYGTVGALVRTTNVLLTITARDVGAPFTWPPYAPNLDYDFRADYPALAQPTSVLDDCSNVAGTITSGWWCFRYGPDMNPLVTEAAWGPMLARMNEDFAYFRDVMGWPPDKRVKNGYYSAIYLFGSGLSTDTASNTALGGWMGSIHYQGEDWPMVLLSYYPVYSFDPACTYVDRFAQQGACVHEGIHAILADMPGCKQAAWFHEGGNTWLQSTAAAMRSDDFSSMGWLSAGAMIAPFMPIECYSGWLQDGSFGGPSAEGVFQGTTNDVNYCTWRNLLGGTQYGEAFPHFMGEIVSQGSVAWIWQNCTNRVLEGLARAPGGLGDVQTRRLIKEYRARQVMCDFGRWSSAYKRLLNNNWRANIHAEYEPIWMPCAEWIATCYVQTTTNSGVLVPEYRTLPAWSGANQIPLQVDGTGMVSVDFLPLGPNMSCQLVYRATDGSVVYSVPVDSGTCSLLLTKPVKNNVVIVVICNTDYLYQGETSRTNKYDYRVTPGTGVLGPADIYTKWFE